MSEKSSCGLFLNPILKNMVKLAPFSLYEKGTKIFKHKREQPFKTMKGGGSTHLQLHNNSFCSPHIAATLYVT